jgi:hypothetical protein
MGKLLAILLLTLPCQAQLSGSGSFVPGQGGLNGHFLNTPTISSLAQSPSATTVVLRWTTSLASDSHGKCGTEVAADDGVAAASTSHQVIVAGLVPSTGYTCTVQSGTTTQTISATTTALAATTPITGFSLGTATQYNTTSPPHQMTGDTYYNCTSNDGVNYLTTDDTTGWDGVGNSSMMLAKFTSLSPITGADVNLLTAYGQAATPQPILGLSPKDNGLFCMNGQLFIFLTNLQPAIANFPQTFGSIIFSNDHGATWNNMQAPTTFAANGTPMSPVNITLFPDQNAASNFASSSFIQFGADDGTLGYLVPQNRFDNGDAFVYGVSNNTGHQWNGNSYYLTRTPKAKLTQQNGTTFQFYVSGDGNLDSSWSTSQSAAKPILTDAGKLSLPSIFRVPALNRYLLMTYNATVDTNTPSETSWSIYEAQHPWPFPNGWTKIGSMSFPSTGCYNPIGLQADIIATTLPTVTFRVMWTCNFTTGISGIYNMFYATATLSH